MHGALVVTLALCPSGNARRRRLPTPGSTGAGGEWSVEPWECVFLSSDDWGCIARVPRTEVSQGRTARWLNVHIHQLAQRLTPARQARADGPDRHVEDRCRVLVAHPFESDQKNDLTLLFRKLRKRLIQLAQLARSRRIGRRGEDRRTIPQVDGCVIADGAPDFVYILVVHDGEEPSGHARSGRPG